MANSIRRTLTEEVCERVHNVKERDPTKDFWVRDRKIGGLALKITSHGTKTFTLDYTVRETKQVKRYRIGAYGDPWTVGDARLKAMRLKTQIAAGRYPFMNRHARTVQDLMEFYIKEKGYQENDQVPSIIRRYILPAIGSLALEHVTPQTVARECEVAGVKGGKSNQGHFKVILSAAWNLARTKMEGMTLPNPCLGIKRPGHKSGAKTMSPEQYAVLFRCIDELKGDTYYNPFILLAIELAALTGNRKEEIANIKLGDIDHSRGVIVVPKHKTMKKDEDEKVIHITDPVRRVITEARKIRMSQGISEAECPYLFISFRRHLSGLQPDKTVYSGMGESAWRKIQKMADGKLDGYSVKHLRSGLASVGRHIGLTDEQIASVTQHADARTVTRSYARNLTEDVVNTTTLVANTIDSYRSN